MQFVQKHFTKHHLLHAPHTWFLALLVSPIHAAEMHYKKRYHLQFGHARKLFLFDILLLLSIVVIGFSAAFWFYYDPTVTEHISLSITPSTHTAEGELTRIRSGEHITYTIDYTNDSEKELIDPTLVVQFPDGFIIENVQPGEYFTSSTQTFTLPSLAPGAGGHVVLHGFALGEPNKEEHLTVRLRYRQADRDVPEEKIVRNITVLRDAIFTATLEMPDTIMAKGTLPLTLTLANTYHHPVQALAVPLNFPTGFTFTFASSSKGQVKNGIWTINELAENQQAELHGILTTDIPPSITSTVLTLTPTITVGTRTFPQSTVQKTVSLVHPKIGIHSVWSDNPIALSPGDTTTLTLTLSNQSEATVKDIVLSLPVPDTVVNVQKFLTVNKGRLQKNVFTITADQIPTFKELAPGKSITLPLYIPIRAIPQGGTDISLVLNPRTRAGVVDLPYISFENTGSTPAVKIGTVLLLSATGHYYTAEGDQLGRGPLPPQVGKETKYGVIIDITNTTSNLSDVTFLATLPPWITWTGKSSVSQGKELVYNPANRSVTWSNTTLSAHEDVTFFMELAFTPSAGQKGTEPLLLQNISAMGFDEFISKKVTQSHAAVTTALKGDGIAQKKGTVVQ